MSTYAIKVTSAREFNAVANKLASQNFRGLAGHQYSASKPIIIAYGDKSTGIYATTPYPMVTFDVFAAINGITLPQSANLRLTSDYSATIYYTAKTITVGCQTIPFATAKKLVALVKKTA